MSERERDNLKTTVRFEGFPLVPMVACPKHKQNNESQKCKIKKKKRLILIRYELHERRVLEVSVWFQSVQKKLLPRHTPHFPFPILSDNFSQHFQALNCLPNMLYQYDAEDVIFLFHCKKFREDEKLWEKIAYLR